MVWQMSAIINQEWRYKTLRELFTQWQAYQLDRWHHTAQIKGVWAGKKVSYKKLHPYIGTELVRPDYSIKVEPKKDRPVFKVNKEKVAEYRRQLDEI